MEGARYAMIRLALRAIAGLGLDRLAAPVTRGQGVVLTFHHVTNAHPPRLPENAGLSITPAFLDAVLREMKALGYEIIPLDALPQRLAAPGERPFAVLTFDDGYRDLRDEALPVLKAHGAPFTAFICTGFAARTAPLWWLDLEDCAAPEDLRALYWGLRGLDEAELRAEVARLCAAKGVDPLARTAALCMDWDELADFAREPLVSIGAHSVSHPRLGLIDAAQAEQEMLGSREEIIRRLGITPRHFCYPVGDARSAGPREAQIAARLGFETGLTTRPGVLKSGADLHLLPRISVNGLFQHPAYLSALVSGLPFLGR